MGSCRWWINVPEVKHLLDMWQNSMLLPRQQGRSWKHQIYEHKSCFALKLQQNFSYTTVGFQTLCPLTLGLLSEIRDHRSWMLILWRYKHNFANIKKLTEVWNWQKERWCWHENLQEPPTPPLPPSPRCQSDQHSSSYILDQFPSRSSWDHSHSLNGEMIQTPDLCLLQPAAILLFFSVHSRQSSCLRIRLLVRYDSTLVLEPAVQLLWAFEVEQSFNGNLLDACKSVELQSSATFESPLFIYWYWSITNVTEMFDCCWVHLCHNKNTLLSLLCGNSFQTLRNVSPCMTVSAMGRSKRESWSQWCDALAQALPPPRSSDTFWAIK